MKNNFLRNAFRKKKNLCIHLSQKEKKKHSIVRRARTLCASSPCCRSFYSRRQSMSLKVGCVRRKIYFKEIVSNTRLDLIHSFFTHLICKFLIILQISFIYAIYIYCFACYFFCVNIAYN